MSHRNYSEQAQVPVVSGVSARIRSPALGNIRSESSASRGAAGRADRRTGGKAVDEAAVDTAKEKYRGCYGGDLRRLSARAAKTGEGFL